MVTDKEIEAAVNAQWKMEYPGSYESMKEQVTKGLEAAEKARDGQ